MIDPQCAWNEAELDLASPFNAGLISLFAFTSRREPKPIGTGFVVAVHGGRAIAMTAAHNFSGIVDVQSPRRRHDLRALAEFLPRAKPLDIDRKLVRAICFEDGRIEFCVIVWVVYDETTDVALFAISLQDPSRTVFFRSEFALSPVLPAIGAEVAVFGYADMEIRNAAREGNCERFDLARRLVLRCGRVTALHPEGHVLCRGSCIETSIPVFSGMSGGPVFRLRTEAGAPIEPFALVSSDLDGSASKHDKTVAGSSVMAAIGGMTQINEVGERETSLALRNALVTQNPEFRTD